MNQPAQEHSRPIHALRILPEKCTGCVLCMKACPNQAIRVVNGKAVIKFDHCVACGACYRVCPNDAIEPLSSDLRRIKDFAHPVAVPSPSLFAQFGYNATPNQILLALRKVGFEEVVDTCWAAELVATAMTEYLRAHPETRPGISPTCPAVVRLIAMRFPSLVPNVLPLLSPQTLAAKWIKTRTSIERGWDIRQVGVFIISPCVAIRPTVEDPLSVKRPYVDGIICASEIYGHILQALYGVEETEQIQRSSGVGMAWAGAGGQVGSVDCDYSLSVSGFSEVMNILEMLEAGRFPELSFVEAHICAGGCLGGPLTVENRYRAASVKDACIKRLGASSDVDLEIIRELSRRGAFNWETKLLPRPLPPLAPDPIDALRKIQEIQEIKSRLPMLECGVCGSPNCDMFAEDVALGRSPEGSCPYIKPKSPGRPGDVGQEDAVTVKDIVDKLGLEVLAGAEGLHREVSAGYVSDLLSDVMAKAPAECFWLTVQTHQNVAAVAVLKDLAAVCLVGGRRPNDDTLLKAAEEGLPLLRSELDAYTLAGKLAQIGLPGPA